MNENVTAVEIDNVTTDSKIRLKWIRRLSQTAMLLGLAKKCEVIFARALSIGKVNLNTI